MNKKYLWITLLLIVSLPLSAKESKKSSTRTPAEIKDDFVTPLPDDRYQVLVRFKIEAQGSAYCEKGDTVITGGCSSPFVNTALQLSHPELGKESWTVEGWTCGYRKTSNADVPNVDGARVFAICRKK